MTRSKWTLALLAAVGVVLYRQTRPAPPAAAPVNLAGSDDLGLPPARDDVVPETMWTPSDPADPPAPTRRRRRPRASSASRSA